jgi:hypothetical protein
MSGHGMLASECPEDVHMAGSSLQAEHILSSPYVAWIPFVLVARNTATYFFVCCYCMFLLHLKTQVTHPGQGTAAHCSASTQSQRQLGARTWEAWLQTPDRTLGATQSPPATRFVPGVQSRDTKLICLKSALVSNSKTFEQRLISLL